MHSLPVRQAVFDARCRSVPIKRFTENKGTEKAVPFSVPGGIRIGLRSTAGINEIDIHHRSLAMSDPPGCVFVDIQAEQLHPVGKRFLRVSCFPAHG